MRMRRLAAAAVCAAAVVPLLVSHANAAPTADENLQLVATKESLLATHFWYAQTHAGHKVIGGFYAKHVDKATGQVTVTDGRVPVSGLGTTRAAVDADRANAAAAGRAHGKAFATELAVLPGGQAKLVYQVLSETESGSVRSLVDASTGAVVREESLVKHADGTGKVFAPNPVATLQNEKLTDQNDADAAVPATAYKSVTLTHLDGSGYLHGTFATITDRKNKQAYSAANTFDYTRSNDFFEQVEAYWAVTETQKYIQSLGFTNINNEAQDLQTTGYTADNSYYDPAKDLIKLGSGGVDDAEDAEVIWHEYGHAIHDAQVPNFGTSTEAGSIGEGFGDFWALVNSAAHQPDTAVTPLACVMDWDSVSYTSTEPHCIRRADTNLTVADKTNEVHHDGQIWSRALFDIYKAFGKDKAVKLVLEAQFSYAPNTSFAQAAQVTVNTAQRLYGATDAATVQAAFHARGIL
ncbi:M36 family metallopeptidase [Actinokineospora sp. HUAS TT18]|uniref:M36 family metallopeptidase n=1 Tax=Actinokineospora sp. HUAS TT18 TaxID=3447451 RepID=UPI003F527BE4